MPMERERYPEDWERIAREVKEEAGWRCEECGKQCRRPGEPFDTHRRTLTVSHVNHDPADCRRENLRALCAPCHLRYDAAHHAETRRKRRLAEREGGEVMELQIKMPVPRPCVVRQDGRALLHGLFVKAWTHGASVSIGGFAAGQETMPMALVELEDGRLDCVAVDAVRMLDSGEVFAEYAWGDEE